MYRFFIYLKIQIFYLQKRVSFMRKRPLSIFLYVDINIELIVLFFIFYPPPQQQRVYKQITQKCRNQRNCNQFADCY
jgi:hypothetical protein